MNEATILRKVRESIGDGSGYDYQTYGDDMGCGSPRCLIGWVETHTNCEIAMMPDADLDPLARRVLSVLNASVPTLFDEEPTQEPLAERVEGVAWAMDQVELITDWLDDAISLADQLPREEARV